MKIKFAFRLSFLAILVTLLLQSCDEDKSSFGEDFEVLIVPTDLSYPEILNAREFSYIETAVPMVNSNGHTVFYELVNIKKDGQILDESYMNSVTMKEFTVIEKTHPDTGDVIKMHDVSENGKIIIEDGNPFSNGDYYFTVKASVVMDGKFESAIFEDALHLMVGPMLVEGISYCPFKMNFVSGEDTASNPAELFGGNQDIRFELGTESDKLTIDPSSGVISLNPSYSISETEYLNPVINVVSNVSEEIVSFENTFTAVLSATPIALEKESNYFYFPTLQTTAKNNVALGGDGYSRVFIEHNGIKAGDPEETSDWYINNAMWKSHKKANKFLPPVPTEDAVAVRDEAGVSNTTKLQMPWWTINQPSESWIIMDPVNLGLYEGCFDSKAVFWYNLKLDEVEAGYEEDGSTPIGLEVRITENYTGNVNTTSWTQVNDILECEIDNNGTIFTGTPYPGNQTGLNPDGLKDPAKNANDLWVRCELNLADYKEASSFTIAFRVKTYFDSEPYHKDSNGNPAVNGQAQLSNVHFVAVEK